MSASQANATKLVAEWEAFLANRGLYGVASPAGALAFVVGSEASQAVNEDRTACRDWLAGRAEVTSFLVGELTELD